MNLDVQAICRSGLISKNRASENYPKRLRLLVIFLVQDESQDNCRQDKTRPLLQFLFNVLCLLIDDGQILFVGLWKVSILVRILSGKSRLWAKEIVTLYARALNPHVLDDVGFTCILLISVCQIWNEDFGNYSRTCFN